MFTLAHELAHVWLAESAAFDLRGMQAATDDVERACDRIAAEFLVPEEALRALWPEVRNLAAPFECLARQFKVSPIVAARRALDLCLVSRSDFFEFYDATRNDERRRMSASGGGNFWNTQGVRVSPRFGEAVVLAAREGRLLYTEAYRLTGVRGATFETYADRLGRGER
jgi:Zn-dependent peptidase ImmA (M78 family)